MSSIEEGVIRAIGKIATDREVQPGSTFEELGMDPLDPECDLDVVPDKARSAAVRAAISNSFAFGGLNAVLAIRRV